jgi:hypothetical protein
MLSLRAASQAVIREAVLSAITDDAIRYSFSMTNRTRPSWNSRTIGFEAPEETW